MIPDPEAAARPRGFYDEDLAFVHSSGFADVSLAAGESVLGLLRGAGIASGLVVDLGCGSGQWAARAVREGFDVLGVDVSPAMLRLAAAEAPQARFAQADLLRFAPPPCVAVTCFGEGLSYAAPDLPTLNGLKALFERVKSSLVPGGVLVFDVIVPGPLMAYRDWVVGRDWAVLVDVHEDAGAGEVTREITVFREVASGYRRSAETHRQRVWEPSSVQACLEDLGFGVSVSPGYAGVELGPRRSVFVARLPGD